MRVVGSGGGGGGGGGVAKPHAPTPPPPKINGRGNKIMAEGACVALSRMRDE